MTGLRGTGSRVVYTDPWLTLRVDDVELVDGTTGTYSVVERVDFSVVVPFDGEHVYLVEQHRYPVGRRSLELPQGSSREHGEDPLATARVELAEETGFAAEHWEHLGRLVNAGGMSGQCFDVFLARGLTPGPARLEASEYGLQMARATPAELDGLVTGGLVTDSVSVAAWALLRLAGRP